MEERIKVRLFDREPYASAIYDINFKYKRDDKSNTAVIIQYRTNSVPDITKNLIKKREIEEIHMLLGGIGNVNFGSKSLENCVKQPQTGIMKDTVSDAGKTDWTKCVSWSKNVWT